QRKLLQPAHSNTAYSDSPASTISTPTNDLPRQSEAAPGGTQALNLAAARAFAFVASSSRFFGGAFVSSEWRKRLETAAISSTAARNAASFAFDGLLNPLIFLTNWREAFLNSGGVTCGLNLNRVLIFLHIPETSTSNFNL